jgi:hypothetical protein
MGIFDRLGDVLKSYLHDEDERIFGASPGGRGRAGTSGDPDVEAAFEELNDFLRGPREDPPPGSGKPGEKPGRERSWNGGYGGSGEGGTAGNTAGGYDEKARSWEARFRGSAGAQGTPGPAPDSLRGDFAELGVPFGADGETCKGAYKKLLKRHHPDRHAGHPGNMQKATEKSARINSAYDRIEKWRTTGRVE